VPVGGPFDQESASIANLLCKKPAEAPILEVSVSQVSLKLPAGSNPVSIAVVGAGAGYRSILSATETLDVSPKNGERVYISWSGLPLDPELESRPLIGTTRFAALAQMLNPVQLADSPTSLHRDKIRFLPGPHFGLLRSPKEFEARIGNDRSRIGIRASTDFPTHSLEVPSEPCQVGTIQVAPSGQILIIGPDGPTTGGYPKLGYVFEADLNKLGQLTLGDRPVFASRVIQEALLARTTADMNLTRLQQILLFA